MTLALTALALLASGPEVYFEQTTMTFSGGRPRGPGVVARVWHAGRKMRLEPGGNPGGTAFILRLDTGKAYRLDPERRTATEMDAERLRAQTQMDVSMAGDLMGVGEEGSARTARLPATKTISGFACRGYRITAGSAAMEVWTTEGVPLGVGAFAEFLEWSGASQAMGGLMGELEKLPGFPLETRTRVTVLGEVQETLSTVTKVVVGAQPAALFDPPPGWQVVREEP